MQFEDQPQAYKAGYAAYSLKKEWKHWKEIFDDFEIKTELNSLLFREGFLDAQTYDILRIEQDNSTYTYGD